MYPWAERFQKYYRNPVGPRLQKGFAIPEGRSCRREMSSRMGTRVCVGHQERNALEGPTRFRTK